jgi:hypothetical protein
MGQFHTRNRLAPAVDASPSREARMAPVPELPALAPGMVTPPRATTNTVPQHTSILQTPDRRGPAAPVPAVDTGEGLWIFQEPARSRALEDFFDVPDKEVGRGQ